MAADQERFYSLNNSYSTNAGPMSDPAVADRLSESGLYEVSVAACAGGSISDCFVATATPRGDQANDSCTTLTIDHTGRKGATGDTVDNCWR
ncbi:MAG: type IV pilin protein [Pseudomonadota bacterium]